MHARVATRIGEPDREFAAFHLAAGHVQGEGAIRFEHAIAADGPAIPIVAGTLDCVGPLGEFNGDAYVDLRDLSFSGIGDWNAT